MTDEELLRQVHKRATIEQEIALARARARTLGFISFSLLATVVVATLVFGFTVLHQRVLAEKKSDRKIGDITTQLDDTLTRLADAQAKIALADTKADDVGICLARYSNTVSDRLADLLAATGELADGTTDVERAGFATAKEAYRMSISARRDWQELGAPLPCPLAAGG